MTVFQEGQVVNWNDGAGTEREGTIVRAHRFSGGWNVLDARGEHWSLGTQELRPAEPRPGDKVRVVAVSEVPGAFEPWCIVGGEFTVSRICKERSGLDADLRLFFVDDEPLSSWAKIILLRRASTPDGEAERKWEPKRGELIVGKHAHTSRSFSGGFLQFNSVGYAQIEADDGSGCRDLLRDTIQPSPPPVGSADAATREDAAAKSSDAARWNSAQPAGGGSSKSDPCRHSRITHFGHECADCGMSLIEVAQRKKPDPYAACRELDTNVVAALLNPRELPATPQTALFISWQQKQRRHLEQAKSELDRKLPSTHPSTWPEGAGEELRCT